MLCEARDATARRIVDTLMSHHGHRAIGLFADDDGQWRYLWAKISDGERQGLTVHLLGTGACVATDIASQEIIARGRDFADLVPSIIGFYEAAGLDGVRVLVSELGSRA